MAEAKTTKKEKTPEDIIREDWQTNGSRKKKALSVYDFAKKHNKRVNEIYKIIGQPEMVKTVTQDSGAKVERDYEY